MTREEAIKYINNFAEESKKKLDDVVCGLRMEIDNSQSPRYVMLSEKNFESIMFDIIRYKWTEQYPDAFLICYVTGEEYDRIPKSMYTYFIKTINGSLKEFMKLNELEDYHIHRIGYTDENRMDMFKKRLRFIEELLNDDIDIAKWCLNNVCI